MVIERILTDTPRFYRAQDLVDATKGTDLMDIDNKDFKAEVTICDHKGLPKDKYVPEDKFEVPDITHQESDTEFDPSKVDAAKDEVYVLEHPKEERRRALLGSGFEKKPPSEYTKQLPSLSSPRSTPTR